MKIMIIDTQGPNGISPAYRKLLPGVTIRGREPAGAAGACHPHGAWCGYLAALPFAAQGVPLDLVFVRCFDSRPRWIADSEWLMRLIVDEAPDFVSRSWGAWDGDDTIAGSLAQLSFADFTARYRSLLQGTDIVDFGAAGNDDANDADADIAYPQADLADLSIIVGACDRNGVPCRWSGDGAGLACVMWADQVASPDGFGRWTRWSGTSAACPKACGAAAALALTAQGFRDMVRDEATRPSGWTGKLPHPKWGWGCAEELWQMQLKGAPQAILPPASLAAQITAHDYSRILRAA